MNEEQRASLPEEPIDRLVGPLARFLHVEPARSSPRPRRPSAVEASEASAAVIGVAILIAVLRQKDV